MAKIIITLSLPKTVRVDAVSWLGKEICFDQDRYEITEVSQTFKSEWIDFTLEYKGNKYD